MRGEAIHVGKTWACSQLILIDKEHHTTSHINNGLVGRKHIGVYSKPTRVIYVGFSESSGLIQLSRGIGSGRIVSSRRTIIALERILTQVDWSVCWIIELPSCSGETSSQEDLRNDQLALGSREIQREAVYLTCSKLLNLPLRRDLSLSLLKHAIISVRSELHSHLTTVVKL